MQTIITYLSILFTTFVLNAQNSIVVEMTNFDSNEGKVMVGLYDEKGKFLEEVAVSQSSKIEDLKASVTFSDVPDGEYAISCYHDEDDNGSLKMFLGMFPLEDYGTSNNAPARFGPPKWDDAKFVIANGETRKFKILL